MNHTEIRVVTGPANYFSHAGSLERLTDFFTPEQLSHAVWVYGERAIAAARPYLPEAFERAGAKHLQFTGHCSERHVAQLAHACNDDRQVVIGVGGGALLDTAKALARRLALPFVAIPTIAATCAAWTPLSVWYNDAGQALQFEIFDDANFLVLVEPRIILQAPDDYLLAGIGDTLAKWYEAVVLAPHPETLPLTVRLGINSACAIRDLLLTSSEQALADKQQRRLTQAFCDVVDAIIAGGGMVGGLGERYTRVAAAHAVHNGLTVLPLAEKFFIGHRRLIRMRYAHMFHIVVVVWHANHHFCGLSQIFSGFRKRIEHRCHLSSKRPLLILERAIDEKRLVRAFRLRHDLIHIFRHRLIRRFIRRRFINLQSGQRRLNREDRQHHDHHHKEDG